MDYYTKEFKQKIQMQIFEEYPAEAMGDQEWPFRHTRFKFCAEVLQGRFRIEEDNIIVTKYGKIPLDNIPELEFVWYRLPKQEVLSIDLNTYKAWIVSKRKRKYPVRIGCTANIEDVQFHLEMGITVWAYVIPDKHFEIYDFEIEEPKREEKEDRGAIIRGIIEMFG